MPGLVLQYSTSVDIYRGSVYWVQQASWAKLYNFIKIGVVCVHILKNKLFFECFFCLHSYFCLHFRGKMSLYLSDHLVVHSTSAKCLLNIWSQYMPNSKFKTTPVQTLQYVYCINPTSSWTRGFMRWVGWVSIFVYASKSVYFYILHFREGKYK